MTTPTIAQTLHLMLQDINLSDSTTLEAYEHTTDDNLVEVFMVTNLETVKVCDVKKELAYSKMLENIEETLLKMLA